ncbi:hypothetical protein KI387_034724, partial [Taxus chinensis]
IETPPEENETSSEHEQVAQEQIGQKVKELSIMRLRHPKPQKKMPKWATQTLEDVHPDE